MALATCGIGLLVASSLYRQPSRPFASTSRVGFCHHYRFKTNFNIGGLDFLRLDGLW